MHAQCWWRPEEGNGPLGTGAMDGCEQPGRCGELNPGPLRGEEVFLITILSFQPSRLLKKTWPQIVIELLETSLENEKD